MPLAQASELLRTSGATQMSDRELAKLLSQLPRRTPMRATESIDESTEAAGPEQADDLVEEQESMVEEQTARRALDSAMSGLSDEDRLIVRMHFIERMTIADIARGLALPQKPLYRRIERTLVILRTKLERAGVSRERVRALSSGNR
jgi:RNA polymerase sigma factor (sigma-70 family)